MKQKIIRTAIHALLIVGVVFGLSRVVRADVSNIDFMNKYAWGTNVGWMSFNFNPTLGVTVYDDHLEGYAWGENVGWIALGTHEGGGTHVYHNTSQSDYGVNNDGSGNLSGYAWSPEAGWINFNPTNGGVIVYDDHLEGYAWGENVGWIRFGTATEGSHHRYGNGSQTDYGVNKDPTGHLTGYAWGSNVGWINFGSVDSGGVTVYPDHLEGYVWGENIGWLKVGTHADGGTHTYGNTSNSDYGVNRDCATNQLSGYAWGTNVGWINFNPTDGGVTVNPETGEFDGYAWGENIGWIQFQNSGGNPYHVEFVTDTLIIEANTPQSYSVGCGTSLVTVNVTDTGGCLTGLTINRTASNPPNASVTIQDGQYWTITPKGCTTGFTVDLTLPHTSNITADKARACRYDTGSSSWDCDDAGEHTTSDGAYVTRTGVTELEIRPKSGQIWAVGSAPVNTPKFEIALVAGWNLVSIPVQPESTQPTDLFASIAGNYEAVYAYDNCTSWQSYNPSSPPFANTLNHIDETKGFWINMTVADTLDVAGTIPDSTTISLCEGWNLVGYPATQTQPIADALNSIAGAYDTANAHDATTDSWQLYNPSAPPFANTLNDMRAGSGYWINVTQAGELTIGN